MPTAVWIARDPRGDRIDANCFGAEFLRSPLGVNVSVTAASFALVHPADRPVVQQRLAAVLEGPESVYTCEYRVRRPDGTTRWCADMARVVRDSDGRALRLAGTVGDITEERLAQAALIDADRRKTEFLAVLSHELRNPLAPIRNSVTLLDNVPPDSPVAKRARDNLRRQAEHLTRLVDDLRRGGSCSSRSDGGGPAARCASRTPARVSKRKTWNGSSTRSSKPRSRGRASAERQRA